MLRSSASFTSSIGVSPFTIVPSGVTVMSLPEVPAASNSSRTSPTISSAPGEGGLLHTCNLQEDVPNMQETHNMVKVAVIDRNAAVLAVGNRLDHIVERVVDLHGVDLGAWPHHLARRQVAEIKHAAQ